MIGNTRQDEHKHLVCAGLRAEVGAHVNDYWTVISPNFGVNKRAWTFMKLPRETLIMVKQQLPNPITTAHMRANDATLLCDPQIN